MDNRQSKILIISVICVCAFCVLATACGGIIAVVLVTNRENVGKAIDSVGDATAIRTPTETRMIEEIKERYARGSMQSGRFGANAIGFKISELKETPLSGGPRRPFSSVEIGYRMKGTFRDSSGGTLQYFVAQFAINNGLPELRSLQYSTRDIRDQ